MISQLMRLALCVSHYANARSEVDGNRQESVIKHRESKTDYPPPALYVINR